MINILVSIIQGFNPTDEEIQEALYDICDRVHSSCDSECPVFALNGNKIPDTANDFNVNRGCDCFKNGEAMMEFIKEKAPRVGTPFFLCLLLIEVSLT